MIFLKSALLIGCRRKTDQIEIHSTQQDGAGRAGPWLEPALLMLRRNESIDRVTNPIDRLHLWNRRMLHAVQRLPAIRSKQLFKFRAPRLDARELLRARYLFGVSRIS